MKIHTTAHLLIVVAEFPIYPCHFFGQFTALGTSYQKTIGVAKTSAFLGCLHAPRAGFHGTSTHEPLDIWGGWEAWNKRIRKDSDA